MKLSNEIYVGSKTKNLVQLRVNAAPPAYILLSSSNTVAHLCMT